MMLLLIRFVYLWTAVAAYHIAVDVSHVLSPDEQEPAAKGLFIIPRGRRGTEAASRISIRYLPADARASAESGGGGGRPELFTTCKRQELSLISSNRK
jgi:hypothetical protein